MVNQLLLHPQAQRIKTIIWSLPLIVSCGYVLYRRLVLGEEQRKFSDITQRPKVGLASNTLQESEPKPSKN
ncbi:hypothetical protein Ac2012v2_007597 [Leucoagaricus gongylophorus]